MPVFNVMDFGAVGNGTAKDTAAVQKAIDACEKAGGGTVLLESGKFLCGTLYLRSGVQLYIEANAVLLASGDIADYAANTHHNRYVNETNMDRCFIYAQDAENISIAGRGIINGNAECLPNSGSIYRPMMMRFLRCSHVRLENLRLYNSAAWTAAILDSEYIWADSLDICNEKNYNGDCLDFDGCRHVYVTNCRMKGTDDCLCLQASSKKYPVENVHITACSLTSICAGIRIGLKSVGNICGVVIDNCTLYNVWREGIKIECTEGGSITDVMVSNISMRNVRRPLFVILNNRFADIGTSLELAEMPEIGTLERIRICGLTAVDDEEMKNTHLRFGNDIMGSPAFAGIRVDAAKTHPIKQLTLRDITYTFVGGVSKKDIPVEYPEVLDLKKEQAGKVSENYYPNWSRAAFMDLRNIHALTLENIQLYALAADGRPAVITEGCKGDFENKATVLE